MSFYYNGYIWDEVGVREVVLRRYLHLWSDLRTCSSSYSSRGSIRTDFIFDDGKKVCLQLGVPRRKRVNYMHANVLCLAVDSAEGPVQVDEFSREIERWERVKEVYAESLNRPQGMEVPSLELAKAYRCRGDMKSACRIFDKLLESNQFDATLWKERGWTALLADMGYEKVVPFYEKAVELDAENLSLLGTLFKYSLWHAKYDRAAFWLDQINSVKKGDVLAAQAQAMLCFARKDLPRAIAVLEDAIAQDWPEGVVEVLQAQLDQYVDLRDHVGARVKLFFQKWGILFLFILFCGLAVLPFVLQFF